MSKRTRLFVGVAVGIVVVGLGTGLVAAYKTGFQNLALFGADGPAELAYISKDARMVAYADIRALMTSQVRQKLHPQDQSYKPVDERTGINFERDVDHVVVSAITSDSTNAPPLVLARGRFDQVRIEGVVRQQGGTVDTYRGVRVFFEPEQQFAVAFVEPDLVALGTVNDVHRAIDTKSSGDGVRNNPEVMRFVREIDSSTAWAVARFDASMFNGRIPGDIARQLPAVKWIAVNGQVDDGVRGTLRAETRDDAAAKDLSEVVRGFMALARLQSGQNTGFATVINSLQLSEHGSTVSLDFAVPSEAIDALPMMRKLPGQAGRPNAERHAVPPPVNAPRRPGTPGL